MVQMTKHCILVVDDDMSIREDMAFKLRAAGYVVNSAANGLDALLQLETSAPPDLIISGSNTSQVSGLEFLATVRRRFPQIPLIGFDGRSLHQGQLYGLPALIGAESRATNRGSSKAA